MMKVKKTAMLLLASGFVFGGLGCLNLNRVLGSVVDHYLGGLVIGFLPDPTTLVGG